MDLVMAGCAGYAGTGILARRYACTLAERLPGWLIRQAAEFDAEADRVEEAIAQAAEMFACCDKKPDEPDSDVPQVLYVGDGGVLGALWFFAERFGLGMDVTLRRIPVRQETVEISEILDVNPYQLYGKGAALIRTDRPGMLIDELAGKGIAAERIGCAFYGYVRRIWNDGTEGYLNVPRHIDRMREGTRQALAALMPES
ncbi:MAG: hypothetical protein J6S83_13870 [Lachnospiraceae bacterium]|nr:hypothetical protein [Lachnospiraceae bacterium]